MENKEFLTGFFPSVTKVYPDTVPGDYQAGSTLSNEPFSFQFAYRAPDGEPWIPLHVAVTAEPDLPIAVFRVGLIPAPIQGYTDKRDDPLVQPDPLYRRAAAPRLVHYDDRLRPYAEENEPVLLAAGDRMTSSLWITVNEDRRALTPGRYAITVTVTSMRTGEQLAERVFTLDVLDAALPENDLIYTNWFHYDCLADIYGMTVWSEEYFTVLERFFRTAVRGGMTTILTPAFTPALDTPVGQERMCVQLVGVARDAAGWHFDFSLLDRFVELGKACGFRYFEHAHLFTQWGAAHAPAIYGTKDGVYGRLFGWDTDAAGDEYVGFLRAYLVAFLAEAERLGIGGRVFFHISDEPFKDNEESYGRAVAAVADLLDGQMSGDALFDVEYYRNGFVKIPIVFIQNAGRFENECPAYMLYYTSHPRHEIAGRLLNSPTERVRGLGLHLYHYKALGFLHWAYNYYYGQMSGGLCDPLAHSSFYCHMSGGTYLVYPAPDRTPIPSIREQYMRDAMNDCLALRLLEKKIGRDAVEDLLTARLGRPAEANAFAESGEALLALREEVNRLIVE